MREQYKVGMALSGGGSKGLAHLGVLKYLEEQNIKPQLLAGTSAGSMVAALYAAGNSVEKIFEFFSETRPFTWTNVNLRKSGIIDLDKLYPTFSKYIPDDSFEALECELKVVGADILNAEEVVFNEGSVIKAIMASSAYPFVFAPVEHEDNLYVDGGIFNHFPADIIREQCEFLIGVYVSPDKKVERKDVRNMAQVVIRSLDLQNSKAERKKLEFCDVPLYIEEMVKYSTFDTDPKQLNEIMRVGYESAQVYDDVFQRIKSEVSVQ